jgi:hypothetical protein
VTLIKKMFALLLLAQAPQPVVLSGYDRLTTEHVREIAAIAQDAGGSAPWLIGRTVDAVWVSQY